ncbi:MAG TPA: sigma-70 family RNA polymerase sigma factor [Pilimelia sp.]|nr:sigma-70 family RNA polymerase sigma factor [Pilimelia sp.]
MLAAAVAGDERAFRRLTAPYRRELLVHCYRMLGSLDDADDAVQEALLKAWRALAGFEGRSSMRAWLYRIATNACLDALDYRTRRILPTAVAAPADPHLPPDPDDPELPWLEPYPDALLDIVDPNPLADPAGAVVRREHVELAFIAAVQYLPPRQRAVLLLREVLGFSAAETAGMLATTLASVNSALQRARTTLQTHLPAGDGGPTPAAEQADLVARYVRAWHANDVPALVALLRADAHMAMPPTPSWYQGRDNIGIYLRRLFASPWGVDLRLVPTAANRQRALAVYAPGGDGYRPFAIKVLTIHSGLIAAVTGFVHPELFDRFGLPQSLPGR